MPRAKTQTAKAKKPTTAELIEIAVQEQLMEALQNIEIEVPQQDAFVDMDLLRAEIKKEVTKEMKNVDAVQVESAAITKSEIRLSGSGDTYWLTSDNDGFLIDKGADKSKNILTMTPAGVMGVGLKSPRSSGRGSAHFRAWYPSEAPLPTSGVGSTRGVIVEGDGDDNKTFSFRAVSRMNRQGFNVTSDGKLLMGTNTDKTGAKISSVQTDFESPALDLQLDSKQYQSNALKINVDSDASERFNVISATAGQEDIFKVSGDGGVYTETNFVSNRTGYAEIFEWEDGNHRNEDRTGLTVTLNEHGQIRIAGEGDDVIGVVGKYAAVVGNAGWNAWHDRYRVQDNGLPATKTEKIVEWHDEVGVLHSYYLKSLGKDFALPENAIIYETDGDGQEFEMKKYKSHFDSEKPYTQRLNRGWGLIIVVGTVNVFKGQLMNPSWFKIKELSEDLEQWFIK